MDPLSLTASVVAITGAVATTTKLLNKLLALRNFPLKLQQLYNEVSDIHAVLLLVAETADDLDAEGGPVVLQLELLLESAGKDLKCIIDLITTKILQDAQAKSPSEISKTGWLRYEARIRDLMLRLSKTRHNITTVLSAHTAYGRQLTHSSC
jgi:hypothetical protein